jgi:hypothetical protein
LNEIPVAGMQSSVQSQFIERKRLTWRRDAQVSTIGEIPGSTISQRVCSGVKEFCEGTYSPSA